MYTSENIPVIIPCFNRPEFLKQSLDSIVRSNLSDKFHYYFSFDAKDEFSIESQMILELYNNFPYKKTLYKRHDIWNGSLNSTGSIGFVLKQLNYKYDSFIYIEEDVIVSQDYFLFCIDSLNYYKNNKYVMMISGHNTKDCQKKIPNIAELNTCISCSVMLGVAGWWNRWEKIDKHLIDFCNNYKITKNIMLNSVLKNNKCHKDKDGYCRNRAGGGLITSYMVMDGRICLVPDISLSNHIGWHGWHIPKEDNGIELDSFLNTYSNTFNYENTYDNNFKDVNKQDVLNAFLSNEKDYKDSNEL